MKKNDKFILRYIRDKLILLEQLKIVYSASKEDRKSTKRNEIKMTIKIKWCCWLMDSPPKISYREVGKIFRYKRGFLGIQLLYCDLLTT